MIEIQAGILSCEKFRIPCNYELRMSSYIKSSEKIMLKNYFLINIRNFIRNWSYSLINLLGLTIGLTAVIIILVYVFHEFSYDRFHNNPENIYRIVTDINMAGNDQTFALTQTPLPPEIQRRYPEITSYTRIYRIINRLLYLTPKTKS